MFLLGPLESKLVLKFLGFSINCIVGLDGLLMEEVLLSLKFFLSWL